MREAIEALGVFMTDIFARFPVVNISAKLDFKIRCVEQAHSVHSAFARKDSLPKIFDLAAKRRNYAETGDDDASFHSLLVR